MLKDMLLIGMVFGLEECPSGRRSTLGKRVCANPVPWVRIPSPPKKNEVLFFGRDGMKTHHGFDPQRKRGR
ncbi:MAG: hypothetical protein S4CHLAM45_04350 [Chlamydiales bacterium]|nr:hypothetical protein [Chlamydiales bacterium]MCH9622551.1 hypothetical protein [Chlamydiales bacterium]